MLRGQYGGDELALENDCLFYRNQYISEACKKSKASCFLVGSVAWFLCAIMLRGEYGGDELALENDCLFYRNQYISEACKQQGITFQL